MNRQRFYDQYTNAGLDTEDVFGEADGGKFRQFQTAYYRKRRNIPEFVMNEQQLRTVLAARCWRFLHGNRPIPSDVVCYWSNLDDEATRRLHSLSERGRVRQALFLRTYLVGQCQIAYAVWRMGKPAREFAREYGISRHFVDDSLTAMAEAAAILGFPTGPLGRDANGKPRRKITEYRRQKREKLTPEQRTAANLAENKRNRERYEKMTPDQHRRLRQRNRESQERRFAKETPEQYQQRLARRSELYKARMAKMTPDQHAAFRKVENERKQRRRAKMTPEQRERYLAGNAEATKRWRETKVEGTTNPSENPNVARA